MLLIKRLFFYGLVLVASYLVAKYIIPEIDSGVLAKGLFIFSIASSAILACTFGTMSRLMGMRFEDLVFWSRRRLKERIYDRFKYLKIRILAGISCSLAIGMLAMIGYIISPEPAPFWLVLSVLFFCGCMVLFSLSAVLEYFQVHQSELDMREHEESIKAKKTYLSTS